MLTFKRNFRASASHIPTPFGNVTSLPPPLSTTCVIPVNRSAWQVVAASSAIESGVTSSTTPASSLTTTQHHLSTSSISCIQSPIASPQQARSTRIKADTAISNKVGAEGSDILPDVKPELSSGQLLSTVSTWGIGGPAKFFIEVHDASQMAQVLRYCHREKIPTFVLGKGSNVLFDDRGFNGCVILNRVEFIEPGQDGSFRAGAGVGFNTLGILTARLGFTGLEFASGIPGTVGGAVFMNAGAHGCETGDVVDSVEIVTVEGTSRTLTRGEGELAWSYRTSPFQQMEGLAAIVAATFKLEKSGDARKRQLKFMDSRRQTQPITAKTAGCVFRNPGEGQPSAGALLDQLGLKGFSIGGAQVSEKHANFLVNTGSATCEDIRKLIEEVKKRVKDRTQVDLHEEIRYVPHGYSNLQ